MGELNKEGRRNLKYQMQVLAFLCVLNFIPLHKADSGKAPEDTGKASGLQSLETGGMEAGETEADRNLF